MLKSNLFGTIQDQLQAKLDDLKATAFIHQQGFDETIEKLQLRESVIQYGETVIYYSQCNAVLECMDILFGTDKTEIEDNFKILASNLKQLESLMNRMY